MMTYIRPLTAPTEYARVAELLNIGSEDPLSPEELQAEGANLTAGELLRETVAEVQGRIMGYCDLRHMSWMKEGQFFIYIVVDPEARRQGLGRSLYADALAFARAQGATELYGAADDHDPAFLRFAQRMGFGIDRHVYESKLDLSGFDEAPLIGSLPAAEAAGFRFLSMADAGDGAEARQMLHQLYQASNLDNPSNVDAHYRDFASFSREFFEAEWYRPEGVLLAAHGDRFAGLSVIRLIPEHESAYTVYTGIDRAYRGKGLAQALKLLAIRYAAAAGAKSIRTNNDSTNEAMLAINRKTGFVQEPGYYRVSVKL